MNIVNNYMSCPICKNIFLKTHIKIHFQICKKKTGQNIDLIQKENINIINLRNINNKTNSNNLINSNKNNSEKKFIVSNNDQHSNKNMIEKKKCFK